MRGLNIGLINARSAVNKAAELHAVIHENQLDILVVVEPWFQPDTPETIALDVAPPGFKVIGVPRSDGDRGGDRAVTYVDHLSVISASTPFSPTSFEMQTIRLAVSGEHFVIMGIYRPPSISPETFVDELADLFDATASIGGNKIFAGDFNCIGDSSETVDARLSALLSCYNVMAANSGPMHLHSDGGRSMLDLINEFEGSRRLAPATATTIGFSDHSLLTTSLHHSSDTEGSIHLPEL